MERATTYKTFERVLEIVKKETNKDEIKTEDKAQELSKALKLDTECILICVRANMLPTRHVVHFCLDRDISINSIVYE